MGVEVGVGDGVGVALGFVTRTYHYRALHPLQLTPAWVFAMCATIHTYVIAIYQTLRYS